MEWPEWAKMSWAGLGVVCSLCSKCWTSDGDLDPSFHRLPSRLHLTYLALIPISHHQASLDVHNAAVNVVV